MDATLVKKLKIDPAATGLVLNPPTGYEKKFGSPDTRFTAKKFDWVVIFVKNKSELESIPKKIMQSIGGTDLLWIAHPKKSGSVKTDLTRDYGWDVLTSMGLETVSLVAIDETWSALRFKRTDKKSTSSSAAKKQKFKAVLEKPDDGMDTAFISIPFDVEKMYGTKGQVKIKASFDGYPYRGVLANMGTGCHVLLVRKDVREAIGKHVGDQVAVEIMSDTEERVVDVPADLQAALSKSAKAQKFFDALSYTNRKEYAVWISSAKKDETRQKRLQETIDKLLKGLKNPSQKA